MLNKLTKLSLPLSQMIRPAGKMTLNWPSIVRTPVSPSFTLPTRYYYLDVKETSKTQPTVNQVISKNVGLSRFVNKVYNTTGLAILGALATSYAVISIPALTAISSQLAIVGIISMIGGFISVSFMKTEPYVEKEQISLTESIEMFKTRNSTMRQAMFALGTVGLGLSSAPLFAYATMISPTILPSAIGLTMAIFGGASLAAYQMPKDKMLSYGRPLAGCLIGLIGLQLVGLLSTFLIGPNLFSTLLFRADAYVAIALFTAFVAYDTHVAIRNYEEGNADHLGMAVQMLLDFWNILTSIVRIMSNRD